MFKRLNKFKKKNNFLLFNKTDNSNCDRGCIKYNVVNTHARIIDLTIDKPEMNELIYKH